MDTIITSECKPPICAKEPMYAARRRQNSVARKFQLGKLRIGQQFQFFNDLLRQLPQGGFIEQFSPAGMRG